MKKKTYKIGECLLITLVIFLVSVFLTFTFSKKINYGLDLKGGFEVLYLVESLDGKDVTDSDIKATYKSIGKRIDTLGVSEPEIVIEGNKIRVKLPGVKDESEARDRLTTPAVLTFRNTSNEELMSSSVLATPGASLDYDNKTGKPVVALSIKDKDTFYRVTKSVSESTDQMITIWLDYKEGDEYSTTKCGESGSNCISAATVKEAFSSNVVIQGNFSEEEASLLVDLINSGSLPTKLTEISTKTVDASYGSNTLALIAKAGIITFIIIALIMVFFYRLSGLISVISLALYISLVFLFYNLIDGVLTLTGIAALILGIGMAVDSSIITLEKIKEEVANGKSLKNAYVDGNKRSLVSLIDANLTTFIAALVLFIFGESSVKGFATMLMLTIIVTSISMVGVNRFVLSFFINTGKFDDNINLFLGKCKKSKVRNITKYAKYNIAVVCLVIIIGVVMLLTKGIKLGVDFKGGSAITIKSSENIDITEVKDILKDYTINEEDKLNDKEYFIKIDESLNSEEIKSIKENMLAKDIDTDISSISNVVKKDLTKNAIKSLIYASIAILIYIAVRFTYNFGVSSIIAILSDVLVTISLFIIFRIEINFIFVAGILTIIGYSINNTIIVFDMIRDSLSKVKKINEETIKEVVNYSASVTLRRNVLTSITTLSAIIVLLLMNSTGVKEFNLTILFGLTFGTFSSLFIAPFVWEKLEIHRIKHPKINKEDKEPEELIIKGING